MIRESRYERKGEVFRLRFAVMKGKSKRWLYQRDVPDEWVQEYCKYVNEARGRPDKNGKFRGPMTIMADIEEETERLKKLKRPTKASLVRPEPVIQESSSAKGKEQVSAKKKQTFKIQENKAKGYYAKKKEEKNKKLQYLRENYTAKRYDSSEEVRD